MSEQREVNYTVCMPNVAVFCSIVAWASFVAGGIAAAVAIANSDYGQPDQTLHFVFAAVLVSGAMLWFALARIITLLAQIAENTRRAVAAEESKSS